MTEIINRKTGHKMTLEQQKDGVKITQLSPFGGEHSMIIDTTIEAIIAYQTGNDLIQQAFPRLNADEREFIMTGIPPSQWPE